jgi:hypothetical protein
MTAAPRLAAILAVDVVGYSRPMDEGKAETGNPTKPASRVACLRAVTCTTRRWRWAALGAPW